MASSPQWVFVVLSHPELPPSPKRVNFLSVHQNMQSLLSSGSEKNPAHILNHKLCVHWFPWRHWLPPVSLIQNQVLPLYQRQWTNQQCPLTSLYILHLKSLNGRQHHSDFLGLVPGMWLMKTVHRSRPQDAHAKWSWWDMSKEHPFRALNEREQPSHMVSWITAKSITLPPKTKRRQKRLSVTHIVT